MKYFDLNCHPFPYLRSIDFDNNLLSIVLGSVDLAEASSCYSHRIKSVKCLIDRAHFFLDNRLDLIKRGGWNFILQSRKLIYVRLWKDVRPYGEELS